MALFKITSPHATKAGDTGTVMRCVLLATLPGLVALTAFFGIGSIINVILACTFAVAFESAALALRNRPIAFYLKDFSAIVTAVLLALALPPYAPWWLVAVGVFFAIVVAKHLYGGLGYNPFNPAMVGYVVLLISFPLEMTMWAAPVSALGDGGHLPSLGDALAKVFMGVEFVSGELDGYTAATPLDVLRQNSSLLLPDLYTQSPAFAQAKWAGAGWEWVNLMFLAGGAYLLYMRVFTWHAPVSMLATLGILAALFYDGGSSASLGSPLFHWLSGATMLGAFFIVTDPVTSAVSTRGRIIYGALIGLVVFVIRSWGNYPDGVAFAVLLMNFAAPFIDYYTQPRTYGHKKPTVATKKAE
ncbi:electron transport complex subunit RsxD [Saccharophagus degradans]|uniref:Ion-translocating oxidoreductase complex subunit D n=1 Tax=Saccharophagus degradans (strain 2-40 / ATCC 43961 / DSM 17024) TaxID=203122 RepID=Q21I16_SACD2|nr:electron transport complex subunit RsxD [Saccharophagus degradans]ABD81663.1 electron transport complex, RnfABCDGE type, D subunit [Saccharophagus degradans 2-40]